MQTASHFDMTSDDSHEFLDKLSLGSSEGQNHILDESSAKQ